MEKKRITKKRKKQQQTNRKADKQTHTDLYAVDELKVSEISDPSEGLFGRVKVQPLQCIVGQGGPVLIRHSKAGHSVCISVKKNHHIVLMSGFQFRNTNCSVYSWSVQNKPTKQQKPNMLIQKILSF